MQRANSTSELGVSSPLIDGWGRVHTSLRISVTDRCNIRCFYCMPAHNVSFLPRRQLLSFEEIVRLAQVMLALGVTKFRLTGGEPLVRTDLPQLVGRLSSLDGVGDLAITTNGILLPQLARPLRNAGLQRINISLDTLDSAQFERITRRPGLAKVLAGIDAAMDVGFDAVRLNAVALHGETEAQVVPLARFALERNLELRFIEYMPLDAEGAWDTASVLPGETIRRLIENEWGPLEPAPRPDPSQPAVDYYYAGGRGRLGFINPVSEPFCSSCNRLRVTAEGQLRNCLFSLTEWNARDAMRGGCNNEQLSQLIRDCVAAKQPGHGIDDPGFLRPARAMYQIGG
jgi:cyclic pyranopterin phosphate synthase